MLFGEYGEEKSEFDVIDVLDVEDSIKRYHRKSPIDVNVNNGEENCNGDNNNDKDVQEDDIEDRIAIFDTITFTFFMASKRTSWLQQLLLFCWELYRNFLFSSWIFLDGEEESEEDNQLTAAATSALFSLKADSGSLEARYQIWGTIDRNTSINSTHACCPDIDCDNDYI